MPVPFRELIDEKTGRFRVRHVDVKSAAYQMLAAYMIRLTRADLEDPKQVSALAGPRRRARRGGSTPALRPVKAARGLAGPDRSRFARS